ncbi:MAG: TetR/AcrR family transcriptional regulator [Leptospiraceae bacterium]|nr:TetR/AcrR family transcriptional regulator [Leptospiraceae bacterium]
MNEKQKRILEVSIEIFYNKGYANTPVRDIIDASGFGTSTFYRYFQNKEEILKQLLENFFLKIFHNINTFTIEREDFYQDFIEIKQVIMQTFIQNPKLSELYSRSAGTSRLIDECLKSFDDKFLLFYQNQVQYGMDEGFFRAAPTLPIAISTLATIKYVAYKWSVVKEISKEDMINLVLSFHKSILYGIVANSE